jgi:hypothetical protein
MKDTPNNETVAAKPSQGSDTLLSFWVSFIVSLIGLGIISALMLAGLFLLMGYHIF